MELFHKMRMLCVCLSLAAVSVGASAASAATPASSTDAMVTRIAQRFKSHLDQGGITGVSQDVLKCYDNALDDNHATRECIVYDVAALLLDRQMVQVRIARGMTAHQAPLYTNEAFDARNRIYASSAFRDDPADESKVGPLANRVLHLVLPH